MSTARSVLPAEKPRRERRDEQARQGAAQHLLEARVGRLTVVEHVAVLDEQALGSRLGVRSGGLHAKSIGDDRAAASSLELRRHART